MMTCCQSVKKRTSVFEQDVNITSSLFQKILRTFGIENIRKDSWSSQMGFSWCWTNYPTLLGGLMFCGPSRESDDFNLAGPLTRQLYSCEKVNLDIARRKLRILVSHFTCHRLCYWQLQVFTSMIPIQNKFSHTFCHILTRESTQAEYPI